MTEKIVRLVKDGDSWLDNIGRIGLYLLGFLLPLWVLPVASNPLGINKAVLAYFLILFSLVVWLIGRIKIGRLTLPKNYLALAFIILVLVAAVSAVFSISRHVSFFELSDDPSSLPAVLMFVLAAFLVYFLFRSSRDIFIWFLFFLSSSFLVFLVQFFWMVLGLNLLPFVNFSQPTANLIGSWSEFGIYFGLIGFISIFLFEISFLPPLRRVFLILAVLSFVASAAVGNKIILWILFIFLLMFLAYLFLLKAPGPKNFRLAYFARPTFVISLIILFFILTPPFQSLLTSFLGAESFEIRPSWPASLTVVRRVLAENVFWGSGPATFVYDWNRHKPPAVNQSPFWAANFSSGASFLISVLAMTGVAGFAAIILLIAAFIFYGFRVSVLSRQSASGQLLVLIIFAVSMLWIYAAIYNLNFLLFLFLFLFLGMFMVLLSELGFAKKYEVILFQNSGSGFIATFAVIFMLIAGFSGFYIFGKKYAAAYFFSKGLKFGSQGNASAAASSLGRALALDGRDQYFRQSAEIELNRISALLGRPGISQDDLKTDFQNYLNQAIQNGKTAIELNPIDASNWLTLGRIYESVLPFGVSGAADFALAAYIEAASRNPASPEPLLAQARIQSVLQKESETRSLLEAALRLKNNYVPAHLMLAQLEDRAGSIKKAIEHSEAAAVSDPNDANALFQLGLLYYRVGRYDDSRQTFERVVGLNPNYSNALYFLGLIYDRFGDKSAAISLFERVSALNSDNQEVKAILANLKAGKGALDGI